MSDPHALHSTPEERAQGVHYDVIAAEYEQHYDDRWSRRYRQQFIERWLIGADALGGKRALEGMCGAGAATGALLARGAMVTGLDISTVQVTAFRRQWRGATVIRGSMLATSFAAECFDVVVILGGLHHLQPHLDRAVGEVHRILKTGGVFCFCEPHQGSIADVLRRVWYKRDPLFERNEAAIDDVALAKRHSDRFEVIETHYGGGVAYLAVYNSMVLRLPLFLKRYYAPPMLLLESLMQPLHGRRFSCFVVSRWRKRATRLDRKDGR